VQPAPPVVEVPLAPVGGDGVVRESRRGDDRGPGPQELEADLVPDLDARAGDDGHPPGHVGGLVALIVVVRCARRAELVVEVVHVAETDLARVAGAEFGKDGRRVRRRRLGLVPSIVGIARRIVAVRAAIRGGMEPAICILRVVTILQHFDAVVDNCAIRGRRCIHVTVRDQVLHQ